jgi:Mn2+/Fe2+ NRAMP family transporter
MLDLIMTTAVEYHLAIMIAVLVLLLLCGGKKTANNRIILVLTIGMALSITYELIADEPISRVPEHINDYFNQPQPTKTTNPHYYPPDLEQ